MTRCLLLATLVTLVALIQPTEANAQNATTSAPDAAPFAQERYSRGVALYDSRQLEPALAEFRASLALYTSPNTRLYIARCLRDLGQFGEAVAEFERTLREAADAARIDQRYEPTRAVAAADLESLAPRVGRLAISVPGLPATGIVRIGGRVLPREALGLPMPVTAGRVEIVVDDRGRELARYELLVPAGQSVTQRVPLAHAVLPVAAPLRRPAATQRPSTQRIAGAVVAGVGVLGVTAFSVFAVIANNKYQALAKRCMQPPCPVSEIPALDAGRTHQLVANVSLGIGIAGLASGVLLYLLAPSSRRPRDSIRGVTVSVAPTELSLGGTF